MRVLTVRMRHVEGMCPHCWRSSLIETHTTEPVDTGVITTAPAIRCHDCKANIPQAEVM